MTKNILITAGEASGDAHAANLIKHLKMLNSELRFFGIGAKKMEEAGVELIERMEKFSIIGVTGLLANLKNIYRTYRRLLDKAKKSGTDLAILVDYPGFNLALAKALKKMGIPIIYYITPQVWAWGKWRLGVIKKYVDKAIVILKFEEELFKKHGIDASFVGHPLLDIERKESLDRKSLKLDEKTPTIALLPGSRNSEIKKILPIMLKTAEFILKEKKAQFVLSKNPSVDETLYSDILKKSPLRPIMVEGDACAVLSICDFAVICSGTATLEAAITEKPMLITYKTSFMSALFAKIFMRTSFIGLVNIIAEKEIAPEILQYDAKPKKLAKEILSILSSKDKLEKQVQNLRLVKHALGMPGASLRAARIINEYLSYRAT